MPKAYSTLQEGCPNYTQRGNLCAIYLKTVKFKVKNQEEINSYKNYQRFISKYSPSQSRKTAPLICRAFDHSPYNVTKMAKPNMKSAQAVDFILCNVSVFILYCIRFFLFIPEWFEMLKLEPESNLVRQDSCLMRYYQSR